MSTSGDVQRELGRVIHRDHDPTCIVVVQELQPTEKDSADVSTKRTTDSDERGADAEYEAKDDTGTRCTSK